MAAVASDAATMLAEALQQMDGLISDDQLIMESLKSQNYSYSSKDKVLPLVEELRGKLEDITRDARLSIEVPGSTIDFLIGWLSSLQNVTNSSSVGYGIYLLCFHAGFEISCHDLVFRERPKMNSKMGNS